MSIRHNHAISINHISIKHGGTSIVKRYVQKLPLVLLALLLAGCVIAPVQALQAPQVPESLQVTPAEQLSFSMAAEGVQIYQCQPSANDATKFEWAFRAPEAILYDGGHNELGLHYGGPTWEANDGSKVIGEVMARADAPVAGAVPWLLLNAKSTEGDGTFSQVTSIQRIETTGGQAPPAGCNSNHVDEEMRVPYTAVYYFYSASGEAISPAQLAHQE